MQVLPDDHLQDSLLKNGSTGEAQLILISEMKRLNVSMSTWVLDRIDQLGNCVPSAFFFFSRVFGCFFFGLVWFLFISCR